MKYETLSCANRAQQRLKHCRNRICSFCRHFYIGTRKLGSPILSIGLSNFSILHISCHQLAMRKVLWCTLVANQKHLKLVTASTLFDFVVVRFKYCKTWLASNVENKYK